MNLDEKLRQLRQASKPRARDEQLEQALDYLRRLEEPAKKKKLPSQRAPKGIEEYVEGEVEENEWGEFFLTRQSLPFGRPYGRLRIGDLSTADLSPLNLLLDNGPLPDPERIVYLDTETTGLAGGTGTCAFLIGMGGAQGKQFAVQQFFLRDYPEEKAMLAALAEKLAPYSAVATFNGKTFDIPLLETRFALARLKSPFARLVHLDLLHPARRLWKLRLESCKLKNLERELLGIARDGDVPGSEIPQIYFDYLRTGSAKCLQPVFFHNALDIVTLAGLTVEVGRVVAAAGDGAQSDGRDLFSLSRILESAGAAELAHAACLEALVRGLPASVEPQALWQLAAQHKRAHRYKEAVDLWMKIAGLESRFAIGACEELAIYYEHRVRDIARALEFTETALRLLDQNACPRSWMKRFSHRRQRLLRKSSPTTDLTFCA